MNRSRLAHETPPPTPPFNDFTRITPLVGEGELSPESQKNGQRDAEMARGKICAAFRLKTNDSVRQ